MRSGQILLALALLSSPALAQKKPAAKTAKPAAKATKAAPVVDRDRATAAAARFSLDLSPSEDPPPPVALNPPTPDSAPAGTPAAPAIADAPKPAGGMVTTDLPPSDVAQPPADGAPPAAGQPAVPAPADAGASPANDMAAKDKPDAAPEPAPVANDAAPPASPAVDPAVVPAPDGAKPADSAAAATSTDIAAPASNAPFVPPPPTFVTVKSGTHFSTDTPIVDLIADPQAKAVLDKDLPGLSDDQNLDKFKYLSLRGFQPMTGGQLTDDMLKTVNDDLAALSAAPAPKKARKLDR